MMSATDTAREATATRPFALARVRLRCARRPGTPAARKRRLSKMRPKDVPRAPARRPFRISRRSRRDRRTSRLPRMASTAEMRLARHAGIVALMKTVMTASKADRASTAGLMAIVLKPVFANASWSMSIPMPSPAKVNTAKVPARPTKRPMGIPMAASMLASAYTVRRSCRLLAPSEESKPNWRVRSETAMANELYMRDMEAPMTTAERMKASVYRVPQMERSSVMP